MADIAKIKRMVAGIRWPEPPGDLYRAHFAEERAPTVEEFYDGWRESARRHPSPRTRELMKKLLKERGIPA